MNWETLINGGFLLIGLLIGHFLTKSAHEKQLQKRFGFDGKSKWINDITET